MMELQLKNRIRNGHLFTMDSIHCSSKGCSFYLLNSSNGNS